MMYNSFDAAANPDATSLNDAVLIGHARDHDGVNQHLVWMGGSPFDGPQGPTDGDRARICQLYSYNLPSTACVPLMADPRWHPAVAAPAPPA